MGVEVMLSQGLCDVSLEIVHDENETQHDTPEALLEWVLKAVPYGDVPCPRLNRALGLVETKSGPNADGVEWKVLSHEAADTRPINVRRELQEVCASCLSDEKAAVAALKEGKERKADEAEKAAEEGLRLPHALLRPAKEATKLAAGRVAQGQGMLALLPERGGGGDSDYSIHEMQFEWLPDVVQKDRAEVDGGLAPLRDELRRLGSSILVRTEGKNLLREVASRMSALRSTEAGLAPEGEPELEPAGELILQTMSGEFFQHRENLYARRQLALNLSKHAARMAEKMAARKNLEAAAPSPERAAARTAGGKPKPPSKPNLRGSAKGAAADASPPKDAASGPRRRSARYQPNPVLQRTKALMLLTPSPDYLERDMRMTPEMVREMAGELGLNLNPISTNPEYWMLWIAVEALRAPLPAPWRYVRLDRDIPEEGWLEGDACFEDAISLERRALHPLLDAFKEQIEYERKRRNRIRPWTKVDSWMLFAGGGDVTFYYDFRTGSRSRELPSELVEAAAIARKAREESTLSKLTKEALAREEHLARAASNRKSEADPAEPREGKTRRSGRGAAKAAEEEANTLQRLQSKQANAEMGKAASLARQFSLGLKPRPLPELLAAGRMLQVDLPDHPELAWMIDLVLCGDYIPIGWERLVRKRVAVSLGESGELETMPYEWKWQPGGQQFGAGAGADRQHYFNTLSRLNVDQHPVLGFVRSAKSMCLPEDRQKAAGRAKAFYTQTAAGLQLHNDE